MDAEYCLDQTRRRFREQSQRFSFQRFLYNVLTPPWWMIQERDRRFCVLYREQNLLLKQGIVVWGCLVQANNLLFKPGKCDHPAVIVCSPDPIFYSDLSELAKIARELYDLKNKKLDHPEMSDLIIFAESITNEMDCPFNVEIPKYLTLNKLVYFTSIMVCRKHLPDGYLKSGWFPMLLAPDKTPAAMILPSRYWEPSLLQIWSTE
jgi:hypothetical protein